MGISMLDKKILKICEQCKKEYNTNRKRQRICKKCHNQNQKLRMRKCLEERHEKDFSTGKIYVLDMSVLDYSDLENPEDDKWILEHRGGEN